MMMRSLLIVGAGGHGRVIADAAQRMNCWSRIAFVDDAPSVAGQSARWEVVGTTGDLPRLKSEFPEAVVGIGRTETRLMMLDRLKRAGYAIATIVHPDAVIAADVVIADGTVVFAGAVINTGTTIGKGCIVNTAASIDHDCRIEDGVHVCPGARLAGGVSVGRSSWVGIGSSIIQQITIGSNVTVGAGAAVVNSLPDDVTAVGVPARVSKE